MTHPIPEAERKRINKAMQDWRQGDIVLGDDLEAVHMADLSLAHSPQSRDCVRELLLQGRVAEPGTVPVLDDNVHGMVMLSHSCEIVRDCVNRPFVVLAPLVPVSKEWMREIRLRRRLRYIFVPATEGELLVGDLEKSTIYEKASVAGWKRTPGWKDDLEGKVFADTLAHKFSRVAFPDDFLQACSAMSDHITSEHKKDSAEGAMLRKLDEILVCPRPSWDSEKVSLDWWFVIGESVKEVDADKWTRHLNTWVSLFDCSGRYRLGKKTACKHTQFTADDYRKSFRLDFDSLSFPDGPTGAGGMDQKKSVADASSP